MLLGAFLHGFGLELFSVNWDLSIQQNVCAEEKLARVYSFDLVGSFVARPLGLALTAPVADGDGFDRWLVARGPGDGRLGAARVAVSRTCAASSGAPRRPRRAAEASLAG